MPIVIDLSGQRFGKLTALRFIGRVNKHSMFMCICDCGKETIVTSNNLRRNHTTSCGCESSKKTMGKRSITHGLSKHPLFKMWCYMRNRCYWDKHNRFEHYGGKGITVCDEWRDDFEPFYLWAINNGWKKGLSIDRRENDKNYCPDNCRFTTTFHQNRNRTSNVKITIDGETKILIEWSELSGINPMTIQKRIELGWDLKDAVFRKPQKRGNAKNISKHF